jgi:hypothetical protein
MNMSEKINKSLCVYRRGAQWTDFREFGTGEFYENLSKARFGKSDKNMGPLTWVSKYVLFLPATRIRYKVIFVRHSEFVIVGVTCSSTVHTERTVALYIHWPILLNITLWIEWKECALWCPLNATLNWAFLYVKFEILHGKTENFYASIVCSFLEIVVYYFFESPLPENL